MSISFENSGSLLDDPQTKREPRWDEEISWFELPDDDEPHKYRLVAAPFYFAQHWVATTKKDGTAGKSFPVVCSNFDSETNTYAENGCECCNFLREVNKTLEETKKDWSKDLPSFIQRMSRRITMASNVIVREIQEQGAPANSDNWTFIKQVRFPQGFAKTLKETQDKYNKRDGVVYALNDMKEGVDLQLSFNSQAKEKGKIYVLQLGANTPLTQAETAHGKFLVDFKSKLKYPDQTGIADSLKRNKYYDWLNEFRGLGTITSVPKANPAPVVTPVNNAFQAGSAPPPALDDSEGDGGTPTKAQNPILTANIEEPTPFASPAKAVEVPAEIPQVPVAKPIEEPKPEPIKASPPVAAPSATGDVGVEARMLDFAAKFNLPLAPSAQTYAKQLRYYRPGLAVAPCWSQYSVTAKSNKDQCRACPVRLDCMMVS